MSADRRRDLELATLGLGQLARGMTPAQARAELATLPFEHVIQRPLPAFYGPPRAEGNQNTTDGSPDVIVSGVFDVKIDAHPTDVLHAEARRLGEHLGLDVDEASIEATRAAFDAPWNDPACDILGDIQAAMRQFRESALANVGKPPTLILPSYGGKTDKALREQAGLTPTDLPEGGKDWGIYECPDPRVGTVHVFTQP